MAWQIVIAGGGFGGFYAARLLERVALATAPVTLVNDANFMLYTPLLPAPPGPRSTRATWSFRCARSCAAPSW